MKREILQILRQEDCYVSGQDLCRRFGVSRTAVWKAINQLKEEGYEIRAVHNKGYHIVGAPDVISAEEVGSLLDTEWAGAGICYERTVDSTNNRAKRLAEEGAPHGTLVLADEQTQGKGRRGRSWMTPTGTNISMTLLIRPRIRPEKASMLTLVMGMAVAAACRELFDLDVKIKWPNDIVAGARKLCGILTEMSTEMNVINYLVIGVGINANTEEFPPQLSEVASSLRMELGKKVKRAEVICCCLKQFEKYYRIFMEKEDLSDLREEYEGRLAGYGCQVRVLAPGNEYIGVSRGINERGELLVEREDGTLEAVYAGEVSIRGICGYSQEENDGTGTCSAVRGKRL